MVLLWDILSMERMTLADIFRDAIGNAISQNPNLDLVVNHYHTLSERQSAPIYEAYFLNLHLLDNASPVARRDTTVLVTLARKRPIQTPHPSSLSHNAPHADQG
ncbi:MAG: hypothetical protein AABY14_03900, partial [Nanoarchaeota archaeon]